MGKKICPGNEFLKYTGRRIPILKGRRVGENVFGFQFPLEKPGKKRVRNQRKLLKIVKLRSPKTSNRLCQENKLIRISSAVIPMSSWCYSNDSSLNVMR